MVSRVLEPEVFWDGVHAGWELQYDTALRHGREMHLKERFLVRFKPEIGRIWNNVL